jgi:dihydroflavonol-4-reductase
MTTSSAPTFAELGVDVIKGSITSPDDVAQAVKGVGEIYHLAGRVSRSLDDAHLMYSIHVDGTRLLCQAARSEGVRSIVLASSSGTIAVAENGEMMADEEWPRPVDIISRWPYYASKLYQERAALEHFSGKNHRLVIVNPSLLLGPGDDRLSSTRVILDFLGRKIMSVPAGGLNFVDARDAARAFIAAMREGGHGEHYLLGSVNWTFEEFFARLSRLTKVAGPRLALPSKLASVGARGLNALYRKWKLASPVEPTEIEMAGYFWYFDSSKAKRDLGFEPRDPSETLLDTVSYVRENFLGHSAFKNAV